MSDIIYIKGDKDGVLLGDSLKNVNYLEADDIKKNVIINANKTHVSLCSCNYLGKYFIVRNAHVIGICMGNELKDMIERVEDTVVKWAFEKMEN